MCCRWKDVRINGTVFYFLFATFFAHLSLAYLVLDGDFTVSGGYFFKKIGDGCFFMVVVSAGTQPHSYCSNSTIDIDCICILM